MRCERWEVSGNCHQDITGGDSREIGSMKQDVRGESKATESDYMVDHLRWMMSSKSPIEEWQEGRVQRERHSKLTAYMRVDSC